MYEYKANLVKVVDGDTVDVDIDLGFGIWLKNERVRVMGIDTPESRTSDKVEKIFGTAAKNRLKQLLEKECILKTFAAKDGEDMKGKFGRILGDFIIGDTTAAAILIDEHHAVKYFGQNKADIERDHLGNREILLSENIIDVAEVQEAASKMK